MKGPPAHVLFGHARELARDPLATTVEWMRRYGDVVPFRIGRRQAYCVSGPDALQEVLEDRAGAYSKRTRGYDELSSFLGRGLLTSEGETWRRTRRVVSMHMQDARIEALRPCVQAAAERELDELARAADRGTPVDVVSLATRITLAVISELLVGNELEAAELRDDVAVLQESANSRIAAAYSLPLWLPLAAHRRAARAGRRVRALAQRAMRAPVAGSLVAGWLSTRTRGEGMHTTQIEDEVVTFLLAGHESTSNTLGWALYELTEQSGWDAEWAHTHAEVLLASAFRETVRLYPQAWSFGRTVQEPTQLADVCVQPGELVMLVPYATHRHPAHWPDAERFDADRFREPTPRHRYAYAPFSGGRRACVGAGLAALEVQTVLRTWLEAFSFRRTGLVRPEPLVTLRPRGGVWLVPKRRSRAR